ncbi:MAG: hypothetical protein IIW81_03365, partial [Oscillospiraceae bacterium]|nr:hypothetical protein [Oscillospiraceae bacterium]
CFWVVRFVPFAKGTAVAGATQGLENFSFRATRFLLVTKEMGLYLKYDLIFLIKMLILLY